MWREFKRAAKEGWDTWWAIMFAPFRVCAAIIKDAVGKQSGES